MVETDFTRLPRVYVCVGVWGWGVGAEVERK